MRPNKSSCKLNLVLSDKILATSEIVADAFNDYFSNFANLLDNIIPSTTSSPS